VKTKRYDETGNYIYKNNDGQPVPIDYYVLVRVTVDPDVPSNILVERTIIILLTRLGMVLTRRKSKEILKQKY
jgi:hypothetical protein